MKYGRTYTLKIQTNPLDLDQMKRFGMAGGSYSQSTPVNTGVQEITITNPLTIQFTVNTSLLASAHIADITVYNLGKTLRELIYKDVTDTRIYRAVTLSAGYGDQQAVIFRGNILYASSTRIGTEWRTSIHCWDGGYGMNNGESNRSYGQTTKVATIINDLVKDIPGLRLKYMSPLTATIEKAVCAGKSWNYIVDLWESYTMDKDGNHGFAYVDREEVFLTTRHEALKTGAVNISADTGLLETPIKFDTKIDLKMLFEPFLRIGQLVNVISEVTEANGLAKIVGMNHSGMISDAICGDLTTSLNLWNGKNEPFSTVIIS